ncbi:MAG: GNAT family N-acetyltransferase [Rhodothermales bacterium]|nr:GNAT family N-acetyltransferase [Rhodothermales bacterium]MBO6780266.1 GNAT family N-acetyltransferase [Rhodothermales bacterium]
MPNASFQGPLPGDIEILPYSAEHRGGVIACFRSNVPKYFSSNELPDFLKHVEADKGPYLVMLDRGEVLACGGFALRGDTADLCWGMVRADYQGKGFGDALMLYRLLAIIQSPARAVRLETSQHTENFFRRYGFSVAEREKDGFEPGLDRVEMRAELDSVFKQLIDERMSGFQNLN